jgi:DNA end-binding protein Ku
MKSIWKGSLSFGLVTIPVRLYSAVQEHAIGFTLLHNKCQTPIFYKRWCAHCKKEVAWVDVVKGLQQNGSYAILTQEKLKALKPKTTDTIAIIEFVNADQIEPVYLEHHYYVGPEKAGEKSFYLFQAALEKSGKVAIGSFVMREKQYVCVINPYENTMLLTTLNYAYEIRSLAEVPNLKQQPQKLSASELKLAQDLIAALTKKKFDLTKFKDTFAQELKAALKSAKKEKVIKKKKEKEVASAKKQKEESSLMTALRASLKAPGKNSQMAYAKKGKRK